MFKVVYRMGPTFKIIKCADLDRNSSAKKERPHMGNKNSCDEGTLTMAGQIHFPFIQYDSATHV